MTTKSAAKVPQEYYCKKCHYTTCHLSHWKKHIETLKHRGQQMTTKMTTKVPKSAENSHVCECGKKYANRSNLHRHKKKCLYKNEVVEASEVVSSKYKKTI